MGGKYGGIKRLFNKLVGVETSGRLSHISERC